MENPHKPLFTVGLISYNNYRFLKESVASVLMQDYPAIELILSDDGSSDFDEQEIKNFIEAEKKPNLVKYSIHKMESNMGTVKNTNNIVTRITGDLFMFFAADDALFDSGVLSRFEQEFSKLPESEYIVTSKAKMSDELLNKNAYDYPFISLGEYYNSRTVQDQYKILSVYCIYASGATAYRSSLFKEHGAFDENYFLVEDLPYWLRLTRKGIRLNFVDFDALLHRDGGVSHPADDEKPTRVLTLYWKDIVRVMETEVLPYLNRFTPQEQDMCMQHYRLFKDRLVRAMGSEAPVMSAGKRISMNWKWYLRRGFMMVSPHFSVWQHRFAKLAKFTGFAGGVLSLVCNVAEKLLPFDTDFLWAIPLLVFAVCFGSIAVSGILWALKQATVISRICNVNKQEL